MSHMVNDPKLSQKKKKKFKGLTVVYITIFYVYRVFSVYYNVQHLQVFHLHY